MRYVGSAKLWRGCWRIECEPHVAIRIKRVFPRVQQDRQSILIRATEEASRDLLWVCDRFPLDLGKHREELEQRAAAYDRRLALTAEILAGEYKAPPVQMELPPREYQSVAAAMVAAHGGLLIADQMGIGKTVSALASIAATKALPALVVCPVHIQRQWARETWRFLRLAPYVAKSRTPSKVRGQWPDVLIMSYAKLSGWSDAIAGHYRTVVFDECQDLRRRGTPSKPSAKYEAAEHVAHAADYRIGLSGTPIYNYGGEFWNVLNILRPDSLGTVTEFMREWCVGADRGDDKARLRSPKAFGAYIRESGLMLRRTREDVGRELPSLSRIVQEVDCDIAALDQIRTDATALARVILGQSGGRRGIDLMQASGEFDMRMRQATGIAKAPYVAGFVRMMLESDPDPVILFGWHRAVYELWLDLLKDLRPAMYTGSESPGKKEREIQRFLSGDARVLIMSLRSGAGVDGLQRVCSRVVVGELDWSPGVHEQCEARVHRDGQESPVFSYYPVTHDGADPVMRDVIGLKESQIDGVRDPDAPPIEVREVDPDHIKKLARAVLERSVGAR